MVMEMEIMNRLLKFTQSSDRIVYAISDPHWNHNPKWPVPLWKRRGYNSLAESNADIRNKINAVVRPNDILLNLGDTTLNCDEGTFESFIGSLNCQNIYTLWGNHNAPSWAIYQREVAKTFYTKGWTNYSIDSISGEKVMGNATEIPATNIEVYPFRYKNMVFIGNYAEASIDGTYFILGHYPIYVFNYMSKGAIHLCGHSHYNLELSQADNPTSKILDVGWDGWGRPLAIQEIINIMKKKNVMIVDHHGKDE